MTTSEKCRRILEVAAARVERLRAHAGKQNKTIDQAVVGLAELRAKLIRRVPR